MKMMSKVFGIPMLGLAVAACGTSPDDGASVTAAEMAAATVSGAVNSSAGGALGMRPGKAYPGWEDWSPIATAYAANRCPTAATAVAGLDCSVDSAGKTLTLVYNSCNFGNNSAVWSGTEILASSAAVSCGQFPAETPGATLLRTFGTGTTRTIGSSVHVASIDTASPSGYEKPVAGGTLTTFKSGGGRTIDIKGVHVLSQKIFRGNGNDGRVETEADHTVSTAVDAPVDVAVTNGKRVVNGTVLVQHNLEKYTGTAEFKDVTFDPSSGCCLPQSGTITTTLTGAKTGTETLTFSGSDCGAAKLENGKGALSDILLTRCF